LSIAVKRLTSCINIFTDEDICFTITEFAMVKDADFDHGYHLLSRKQKTASSEARSVPPGHRYPTLQITFSIIRTFLLMIAKSGL
jgi:hypothetical protein